MEWYTDVQSGKGADAESLRPNLKAALARAKKVKCPLVVSKLDRLSRGTHYITGLMTRGEPTQHDSVLRLCRLAPIRLLPLVGLQTALLQLPRVGVYARMLGTSAG
ncbi:MAG: recombinase family protein [Methylococcus sp.]